MKQTKKTTTQIKYRNKNKPSFALREFPLQIHKHSTPHSFNVVCAFVRETDSCVLLLHSRSLARSLRLSPCIATLHFPLSLIRSTLSVSLFSLSFFLSSSCFAIFLMYLCSFSYFESLLLLLLLLFRWLMYKSNLLAFVQSSPIIKLLFLLFLFAVP